MLEHLEAELRIGGMPPDEVRVRLLEEARKFRGRELGDVVLSEIPPPTGAGHWSQWQFEDGIFSRDFEDRNITVHGIEIQIVGSQTKDTWSGDGTVSTTRKLRVAGQAVLTPQEAQEVASAIWGDVETMKRLDHEDNSD